MAELEDYIDLNASRNAIYCKNSRLWNKMKNLRVIGNRWKSLMRRKHIRLRRTRRRNELLLWEKAELNKSILKHNR